MKSTSIKFKVISVLVVSLAVGAAVLVGLVRASYQKNVSMVAEDALHSAQKTFENLKADELRAQTLVGSAIANLEGVREPFAKRDRAALYDYLLPAFTQLKTLGVGFVLFVEPDGRVFLRMHDPKVFGDSIAGINFMHQVMVTNAVAADVDLAKPGFVTASVRPFRDKAGAVIGYLDVSGSFDKFLAAMKSQTSDDYTLIGYKKFLDQGKYTHSQEMKGLPNGWDQFGSVVALGQTAELAPNGGYDRDFDALPRGGQVLGESQMNGSVFIRGVFPLIDSGGRVMGGIFVRHDISRLHDGMQKVQQRAIGAILILMIVLSLLIAAMLSRLVFARLRATMAMATRVVGGEFDRQIIPSSSDEVGQLEMLFEQFRVVFVDVVDQVAENRKREAGAA